MNIEELFRRLSKGELSNLSLAQGQSGSIQEDKQEKILEHTREALLRLYSQFILREEEVVIIPNGTRTRYNLPENCIRPLEIWDAMNCPVPLNNQEDRYSVFTPAPGVLQIPLFKAGQTYSAVTVVYQAAHEPIGSLDDPDSNQEIVLPLVLEAALTAYVAHLEYAGMNSQEHQQISANHLGKYNAIVQDVIDKDLVSSSRIQGNSRFERNGFV